MKGINSVSLCGLVGRYDNPIPTLFLAPIYYLKIPALKCVPTYSEHANSLSNLFLNQCSTYSLSYLALLSSGAATNRTACCRTAPPHETMAAKNPSLDSRMITLGRKCCFFHASFSVLNTETSIIIEAKLMKRLPCFTCLQVLFQCIRFLLL